MWSGRVVAGAPPRHRLRRAFRALGCRASGRVLAGERGLVGPVPRGYSVLLNSAIATSIIATPITATMPRDNHSGTTQPPQVISGAR